MALIAAGVATVDARDRLAANWGAELQKYDPIR